MPFDSLYVGVSGLDAYQNQIDVISNNIANVNTTGFKGQDVTFQDLLYQTQSFGTAPTATKGGVNAQDVGYGVKVGSTDTNYAQGGLNTTGVNTDLALNGDGFFVLGNKDASGTPSYTRDGHFSLNQDGLLYDPTSGLAVQGYVADKNGKVNGTGVPTSMQIPIGLKSQAVGTGFGTKSGPVSDKNFDVSFGGNLDQTQYISAAANGTIPALTTISTTLYDSLGGAHLVGVAFSPAVSTSPTTGGATLPLQVLNAQGAAVTAATEWQYTISPTDGTNLGTNTGYAFFDTNGQFINTSATAKSNAGAGAPKTDVYTVGNKPNGATFGNQLTVASWNTPVGANNAQAITTLGGPIGLDFSNMTSLAGSPTPTTVSQNGYGQGTLSNITIGADGTIEGAFTNGQTQALGQIAIATFQNEQGLHRVGSSKFQASANSGLPQLGTAGGGRFGSVVAGSLEQANVSIADEFTKMISAQRAFQANSSSITTADQDLQTVIALKR